MEERKTIIKVLDRKDYTHKDAVSAYMFWVVIHTDFGGYTENEITVHVYKDGSAIISGDDAFLSLNTKQVDFLLKALTGKL